MEPFTHFLTGACIGRAGLNRKTACATVVAVLAAEAADLDVVWGLAGPVEELKHHRGITHTFIAAPVVAAVVVGVVWGFHRWRQRNRTAAQPMRLGWLYLTALIAALSHVLLDWTNNYGVRPFFPFNPRWYAGSFMFIAEPVLWGIFLIALFMPWVLGLADREIGARKTRFRGRAWAIFALVAFALYGTWRWTEHAIGLAMLRETEVAAAPVTRMALEPYPVNPYRWHAILETSGYYQTAEVNTWNTSSPAAIASDPHADVLYKPTVTPAVEAAKRTLLGRVYLDWGSWAVVRDEGKVPVPAMPPPQLPPSRTWTTVTFNDLRFDYSFLRTQSANRAPLSGWAYIVDGREEAGEGMGNRVQRTGGAPSE
jgi:inner membrane protein